MAKNKAFTRHLTIDENKVSKKKAFDCSGCAHWRSLNYSGVSSGMACHYTLDEQKTRHCTAEECFNNKIFFTTELKNRKRFNRYLPKTPKKEKHTEYK